MPRPNGPAGVSEAMSGGTPGRSDATAIQANGTAHSSAIGADREQPGQTPLSSHNECRARSVRNEVSDKASNAATLITVADEASPVS